MTVAGYLSMQSGKWWEGDPVKTAGFSEAMTVGGLQGGEYLEGLGQSDLASLTETEWDRFIDAVVTGYCDHLRELAVKDRNRLDAMTPEVPF